MSQEKLISLKAAAKYLGISELRLKELAEFGMIPAYRIGGIYLRFKKSQIQQFKDKIQAIQNQYSKYQGLRINYRLEEYTFLDRIKDFWYYYDFYILSTLVIILMLFFIFRSTLQ